MNEMLPVVTVRPVLIILSHIITLEIIILFITNLLASLEHIVQLIQIQIIILSKLMSGM